MHFLMLYDEGAHDTSTYLDRQKHSRKKHFGCDVMLGVPVGIGYQFVMQRPWSPSERKQSCSYINGNF